MGVTVATVPSVDEAQRLVITPINDGSTRIDLVFGYMEEANIPKALMPGRRRGIRFDIMLTTFS